MDSLIGLSPVSFPASVALLIVLFFGLIVLEIVIGERRTRSMVKVIDVPVCVATSLSFKHDVDIEPGRVLSEIHQCILYAFIW